MKIAGSLLVVVVLIAGAFFVLLSHDTDEQVVTDQVETPVVVKKLAVLAEEVNYFENTYGYLAEPAVEGDYPAVVMIHENRGLRPEIKQVAEDLAALGYRVLAVDLFDGLVMETQEEARAYSAKYDKETGLRNMQTAVEHLRSTGSAKVASLGWCFGGAESLALSTSGMDLDATVIYYGRLTDDTATLAQINSPVLGIFGDQDQVVPVISVEKFEQNLDTLGIASEIYLYEGVGHAFANPSNPNFAPEETADAWEKTVAFLEKNLR